MTTELKQAAQQAVDAFDAFGDADDFASLFELTQKMRALRTAIQQAEAQQPVTTEPVAWNSIQIASWIGSQLMHEPSMFERATVCKFVRSLGRHPTLLKHSPKLHPAPSVPDDVAMNAERWRHAISDGGKQSMSFIDIFNGWDGDGDFVEAFDAAMLAANEGGK